MKDKFRDHKWNDIMQQKLTTTLARVIDLSFESIT